MRWRGRRQSQNIEDRRASSVGPALAGGGGIMTLIVIIVVMVLGGDPQKLLQQMPKNAGGAAPQAQQGELQTTKAEEDLKSFVAVVLADTEDIWNKIFAEQIGKKYNEPKLVLFRDRVNSACGMASSATGPFYCPGDDQVYLDMSFFEQLRSRFGAPGDFAMAYVVAHEVAHHVQNELGISDEVHRLQQSAPDKVSANRLSVRLELQADFLSGVWAHHGQKMKSFLESGDLEEAMQCAQAIGDDRIQQQAQGQVVPDAFTHGTSAQRARWFRAGLETGKVELANKLFELEYDDL